MICLRSKSSATLQNASFAVSGSGEYGTWAFLPVTDGTYIQQRPSQALLQKKINGRRHLSGVSDFLHLRWGYKIIVLELRERRKHLRSADCFTE
jgi:hypothetical protein